jgi:sirohydrochlorin ferrochelatase
MTQQLPSPGFSRRGPVGVILLSHGSSVQGASDALFEHAEGIRARGVFHSVEVAFVNLGAPSLETAAERSFAAGVCRIVVVPYFLVSGRFVQDDVAKHVAEAQQRWPAVEFVPADSLGDSPYLVEAVIETAASARSLEFRCQEPPLCSGLHEAGAAATGRAWSQAALLIVAHGSPNRDSTMDIARVRDSVRQRELFADVRLAFLQHAEPGIPAGLEQCVATGVRQVIAVPYFLHAGKHVVSDVPGHLARQQAAHPDVEFLLGDFIGRSVWVTRLLVERAQAALER